MVAEGYKNTEIGVIPEDWDVKSLGSLFEITSSKRVFQSEWKKSGIPFYRARELAILSEKGVVVNDLYIDIKQYQLYKKQFGVPVVGDMLVTGVGTLGKVYVIQSNREFYFKDGNIIWFKIKEAINSEFLKQLFSTVLVTKQIDDASGKTTVGTYTINGAKHTSIPFPPKPEQNAIATALSDADALISATEKLIAKKKAIKQGAMQELLKPKEGWEEKSLGNLGFIKSSSVDKIIHPNETIVNLLNYMDVYKNILIDKSKISAITSANSIQCNSTNLIKGDIVFTPTSETPNDIGRASLLIEDLTKTVFSYHLTRLRFYDDIIVNELKPYIFNSEQLRAYFTIRATGSTRFVLKKADFEDAVISFPKSKSEQTRIATIQYGCRNLSVRTKTRKTEADKARYDAKFVDRKNKIAWK